MSDLKSLIRTIPDYPKPGIMFRDVTTLLGDAQGFKATIAQMAEPFRTVPVDAVAGGQPAAGYQHQDPGVGDQKGREPVGLGLRL